MISPPNISLLTGSVVKVPDTAIWVVQELTSRERRGSRQRCILLPVVPRSGISPFQGPLGRENKGLERTASGLDIPPHSVSGGSSHKG